MTRCKIVRFFILFLTCFAAFRPGDLSAQFSESSTFGNTYTGLWNHQGNDGYRSVILFNPDGTWANGTQRQGTWAVEKGQLMMRFNGRSDWLDRFDLPIRAGTLNGHDGGGGTVTLTRRSLVTPPAVQSTLVGPWEFFNSNDGKRTKQALTADGIFQENGQLTGFWTVDGDQVLVMYKEHHDWLDTYDLPPRNGVLHGRNKSEHVLTLSKPGTPLASIVSAATPPSTADQAAYMGSWNVINDNDGKRFPQYLAKDGRFTENGQAAGTWEVTANHLVLTYKRRDWADTYDLPLRDGVLHGRNTSGNLLTLARLGARVGTETEVRTTPVPVSVAVATPPAVATSTVPPSTTTGSKGASYFGTTGPVGATRESAEKTPLTPLATPTPSVALAGGFASGASRPMATPTVVATPMATVAETPAPALTPVGKWHWHSGDDHNLTDKGAVLRDARVVGQWKWTDKTKGQIQVQMTDGAYRAPTVYTLSPHGNHLTGKSPTSGNEHTEDRIP